jgi:hypothetical protein
MASFYKAIPRINFDTATLTASYQSINTSGLPEACLYLAFTNNSSNGIEISFDGVTDHDVILGGVRIEIPPAPFLNGENDGVWKKTQQIWVKGATSTAGDLFVAGYYL